MSETPDQARERRERWSRYYLSLRGTCVHDDLVRELTEAMEAEAAHQAKTPTTPGLTPEQERDLRAMAALRGVEDEVWVICYDGTAFLQRPNGKCLNSGEHDPADAILEALGETDD